MTRIEARRRRRRRKRMLRKIQMIGAWTALVLFELAAAVTPTMITAAIVLPLAYRQRGYEAYGGEWILILLVFCCSYNAVHQWICNKIYEREEARE